jgi:predicted Holliday junction resolvase-like endonuclease
MVILEISCVVLFVLCLVFLSRIRNLNKRIFTLEDIRHDLKEDLKVMEQDRDCREETLKLTHYSKNNWIELRIDTNYGEEFLFQGTIKNKSELKKVLKMIGYE